MTRRKAPVTKPVASWPTIGLHAVPCPVCGVVVFLRDLKRDPRTHSRCAA